MNLKWIFVFLLSVSTSFASIHPGRVVSHLFFVNHGPEISQGKIISQGIYVMPSKKHPTTKAVIDESRRMNVTVAEDFFQQIQEKALSVFEIHNQTENKPTTFGTGFLVGPNMVLTNHHVIFSADSTGSGCFTTKIVIKAPAVSGDEKHSLSCKKIHYCDEVNDFCFAEFYPLRYRQKNYDLSELFPIVKFNAKYLTPENSQLHYSSGILFGENQLLFSINNSFGLGLQASSGNGFIVRTHQKETIKACKQKKEKRRQKCLERERRKKITQLHHFAPVFPGASGSPVFNRDGEVVAITRAMSNEIQYGPQAVNYATPINVIQQRLLEASQHELLLLLD